MVRRSDGRGEVAAELARSESVDSSYVSRMVNLTTLAPDIMAAILDETLPPELTLFELAVDPPVLWEEQQERTRLALQTINVVRRSTDPPPD